MAQIIGYKMTLALHFLIDQREYQRTYYIPVLVVVEHL